MGEQWATTVQLRLLIKKGLADRQESTSRELDKVLSLTSLSKPSKNHQ